MYRKETLCPVMAPYFQIHFIYDLICYRTSCRDFTLEPRKIEDITLLTTTVSQNNKQRSAILYLAPLVALGFSTEFYVTGFNKSVLFTEKNRDDL